MLYHIIGKNAQTKAEQMMDHVQLVLESVVHVSEPRFLTAQLFSAFK